MSMMTTEEVCEALNVRRAWLLDQCRENGFPHVRMGRLYRFDPAAIKQWIEENTKEGL